VGQVADAAATEPVQAAGDPVVLEAVSRAAADLSAGRIADMNAAVEAVVEHIVAERFPHMEARQRQRMAVALQRLLADDPGLGAQIAALIQGQQG